MGGTLELLDLVVAVVSSHASIEMVQECSEITSTTTSVGYKFEFEAFRLVRQFVGVLGELLCLLGVVSDARLIQMR